MFLVQSNCYSQGNLYSVAKSTRKNSTHPLGMAIINCWRIVRNDFLSGLLVLLNRAIVWDAIGMIQKGCIMHSKWPPPLKKAGIKEYFCQEYST